MPPTARVTRCRSGSAPRSRPGPSICRRQPPASSALYSSKAQPGTVPVDGHPLPRDQDGHGRVGAGPRAQHGRVPHVVARVADGEGAGGLLSNMEPNPYAEVRASSSASSSARARQDRGPGRRRAGRPSGRASGRQRRCRRRRCPWMRRPWTAGSRSSRRRSRAPGLTAMASGASGCSPTCVHIRSRPGRPEEVVPERGGQRLPGHLLDHLAEHLVVGPVVLAGSAHGADPRQVLDAHSSMSSIVQVRPRSSATRSRDRSESTGAGGWPASSRVGGSWRPGRRRAGSRPLPPGCRDRACPATQDAGSRPR